MAFASVRTDRRSLLRGRPEQRAGPAPLRPPWAAERFSELCTGCGRCVEACPEGILVTGADGYPEVDFRRGSGECTFCAACVATCPEPALADQGQAPWYIVAQIGTACLALSGVHCQSCGDACPESVIRFAHRLGGPPVPMIDSDGCTGCGACVAVCPAEAITVGAPGRVA